MLQALLLGRRVPDGCRVGTLLNLHGCIRCHFDTKIFGIVRGPARRRNLEHAAVIEGALAGGGLNEATTGYKKNERAGRRVPGPDSGPAPRPSGSREKKAPGLTSRRGANRAAGCHQNQRRGRGVPPLPARVKAAETVSPIVLAQLSKPVLPQRLRRLRAQLRRE